MLMTQSADNRVRAKQLFDEQNFEEAADLYRTLWYESQPPDKWDGYNYARALRKLGRTQEALEICREVYQLDNTFTYNNNEYGWCIYYLHVKKTDQEIKSDPVGFFRAAKAIIGICSQDQYSPYERTVFQVLRYLKPSVKRREVAKQILDWTDKLDVAELSTVPEQRERDGEPEEHASPREKWFMSRSSALYELGEYQACIDICEQALESFGKLHYGNQNWFKMRIANSKGHLGQIDQAISELQNLLHFKSEWFIHRDLALWLRELGRVDEAYTQSVHAALSHRKSDELENKWELFLLMGQLLQQQGDEKLAQIHTLLAYKLRLEQQWKLPQDLMETAQRLSIDLQDPRSADELYRELRKEWQNQSPRMHGKVKMVNLEKEFGFIIGEDGQDYHFKFRDFRSSKQRIDKGLAVTFVTQPSYDRARARETTIAVDIREAN